MFSFTEWELLFEGKQLERGKVLRCQKVLSANMNASLKENLQDVFVYDNYVMVTTNSLTITFASRELSCFPNVDVFSDIVNRCLDKHSINNITLKNGKGVSGYVVQVTLFKNLLYVGALLIDKKSHFDTFVLFIGQLCQWLNSGSTQIQLLLKFYSIWCTLVNDLYNYINNNNNQMRSRYEQQDVLRFNAPKIGYRDRCSIWIFNISSNFIYPSWRVTIDTYLCWTKRYYCYFS